MKRRIRGSLLLLILATATISASPVDWHNFTVTRSLSGEALPTRAEHLANYPETSFQLISLQTALPQRDDPAEEGTVVLMVNNGLYEALEEDFDLWVDDLRQEGYTVIRAAVEGGTPAEVKEFVFEEGGEELVGVIFAGEAPLAFMEHYEYFYGEEEPDNQRLIEYPIDLFFMDRDGVWEDTTGNGIYDYHHGNVWPEIWLGRLPAYNLSHIEEVPFVEDYLDRIHRYRQGEVNLPHRALCYIDDDWALSAPEWARTMRSTYGRVVIENQIDSTSATRYRWYLEDEGVEFVQVAVHSTSDSHSFLINGGTVRDYFRYFDLRDEVNPRSMFYNLFACSIMNMAGDRNLCMGVLYAMKGPFGLGSAGSTKTGGMLFWDEYYQPLSEGESFGEALRLWMMAHLREEDRPNWARSWFYGMTHYGDPTLKINLGLRAQEVFIEDPNGDNDGLLDAGERISLTIPVANLGRADFFGIDVSISTEDSLVEIHQPDGFLAAVEAGGFARLDGFELTVAEETPDEHVVCLNVTLTPAGGEVWLDQIELPARSARLEVTGLGWDETDGDGDGLVEAGESGMISTHFRNVGGDDMRQSGWAEIISLDGRFWLERDTLFELPPVQSGEVSWMAMSEFQIDPNLAEASAVYLRVRGRLNDIPRGEGIMALPCRADFQLDEDFRELPVWTRHYTLMEGYDDPWRWGSEEAGAVGVLSIGGPDSLFYVPNCDAAWELPLVMFSEDAVLEIRHQMDVEAMFDAGVVEVDRGAGWRRVEPEGGYNGLSVANGSYQGGRCWNGSFGWTTARVPLGGPAGPLRVRLHFSSDAGVEGAGWQIDYLRLDGVPLQVDPVELGLPQQFALTFAYPNPFNSRLSVRFDLSEAGVTRLTLHDLSGRLIRELTEENLSAGQHRRSFDLESLPSSIYLLQMTQGHNRTGLKVVLVK